MKEILDLILKRILIPVIAKVVVDLFNRYENDPFFKEEFDRAREKARQAKTDEEVADVARDVQKLLA